MKKKYFLFFFILFFLGYTLWYFLSSQTDEKNFVAKITSCNHEPSSLRFSCYRSTIDHYYASRPKKFIAMVNNPSEFQFKENKHKPSYAVLGPNCHTFYHAVGDFIAENILLENLPAKNVREMIRYCPSSCTSGCIMGLYKRIGLKNNFSTSLLKEFNSECSKKDKYQCVHEIGHLLHDKYTYSTLRPFDEISNKYFNLQQKISYSYNTRLPKDLSKAFEECNDIISDPRFLVQCYRGIGHNMFIFSALSQKNTHLAKLKECKRLRSEKRKSCIDYLLYSVGLNEAAAYFLSDEKEKGNALCNELNRHVENSYREKCYNGVGAGIGMFTESEFQYANPTSYTTKELQLAQNDLRKYAQTCEMVTDTHKADCYRGLLATKYKQYYRTFSVYYQPLEAIIKD